jgi:hypothetical protein
MKSSIIYLLVSIFLPFACTLGGEPAIETKDYSKASAAVVQSWCDTPSTFDIRIGLPGWLSAISGDFGIKGVAAPLDVSVDEILPQLDSIPIVLSAYVRSQRWEFFVDGEYIQLHDSFTLPGLLFTNSDIDVQYGFVEGFVGYRLINCTKASLSLYGGLRYTYYGGDFSVDNVNDPRFPVIRRLLGIPQSGRVSGSKDWVDPVLGIGGRVQLAKAFSLWVNADVGGFDVGGDDGYKLALIGRTPVREPLSSSDWSYQQQD